jgi:hypothetical protein
MNLNDANQAAKTEQVMLIVNIALRVLSHRALAVFTLVLNAGVCSWAMYSESWVRLAGALLFAVTSWCTVNLKPPKGLDHES